jgi:hypothetical protein
MHSVKESYSEPRVPDGTAYYSFHAKMQAVTIVYLSRFLNEFLSYLSGLFFLCPPAPQHAKAGKKPVQGIPEDRPLDPAMPTAGRTVSAGFEAISKELHGLSADTASGMGTPILLDVEMNAPVIEMPRHSTSDDSLEVDLGVLKLTNRVVCLDGGLQVVDVIDISLQQV